MCDNFIKTDQISFVFDGEKLSYLQMIVGRAIEYLLNLRQLTQSQVLAQSQVMLKILYASLI